MLRSLFARKSVADCEADAERRGGLKRSLGKWHLTALGVGATIGAGIFAQSSRHAALSANCWLLPVQVLISRSQNASQASPHTGPPEFAGTGALIVRQTCWLIAIAQLLKHT